MISKVKFKNFTLVNITNRTIDDIETIASEFKFHHLSLEDCLSNIQQPKVDDYDDYLFLVFHLPRYVKKTKRTVSLEIDVFLGKDYLVISHSGDLKPLNKLIADYESKKAKPLGDSPAYLLYEILSYSFNYCFPMLEKIGVKLDKIEDQLYEDQTRKTLEEISIMAQDIINFRRVIGPQRYLMSDLDSLKTKFITENLEIYFDDISDKIDRIWDTLTNYKEVYEVLQKTNESILTQRLNEIMKILTVISVFMLPLTVITGFYGMNVVGLPFANYKLASEIIISILALVVVTMAVYFRKKRWL